MHQGLVRTCAACPPRESLLVQRLRRTQYATTAVCSDASPASALAVRADNATWEPRATEPRSPNGKRSTRDGRCTTCVRALACTVTPTELMQHAIALCPQKLVRTSSMSGEMSAKLATKVKTQTAPTVRTTAVRSGRGREPEAYRMLLPPRRRDDHAVRVGRRSEACEPCADAGQRFMRSRTLQ